LASLDYVKSKKVDGTIFNSIFQSPIPPEGVTRRTQSTGRLFLSRGGKFKIAFAAFKNPEKFIPMSDLLATIIAILIGVSLAISAVLASPPKIDKALYASSEDGKRAQKILDNNYTSMLDAQKYLFWVYYASLMLAVCLKFVQLHCRRYCIRLTPIK